jgi:hypothetical protein
MAGVDILATEDVATAFAFNWTAFWIAAGIAFCILAIIGIVVGLRQGYWDVLSIFLFGGIVGGAILGPIMGFGLQTPTEYETQYKVTVSDEVSMVEFHEKYEIIKTEGKIYTVREKE